MTCVFCFLSQETKRQCFGIRNADSAEWQNLERLLFGFALARGIGLGFWRIGSLA